MSVETTDKPKEMLRRPFRVLSKEDREAIVRRVQEDAHQVDGKPYDIAAFNSSI